MNEVERLLRRERFPLVIASPTLAQGLNLSASVLLTPSIWRHPNVIPTSEFANVTGRAGRAFVDLEGLILHVIWEQTPWKRQRAINRWNDLVADLQNKKLVSGLLQLVIIIAERLAEKVNVSFLEVLDYVTSDGDAWSFAPTDREDVETLEYQWDSRLASLDSAILELLSPGTDISNIETVLEEALQESLFSKMLAELEAHIRHILPKLIVERARYIWRQTNENQRLGYYRSGIGHQTGSFIDTHLTELVALLSEIENAIDATDGTRLADATLHFASYVLNVAPFRPSKSLPVRWEVALKAWMLGEPAATVISAVDKDGVDFLQDGIIYRLPWAMEAVRIHAISVGVSDADELTGIASTAVTTGASHPSAIRLIRSGFRSRDGARVAVDTTDASFKDRAEMETWIVSQEVNSRSSDPNWPTARSRHEWDQFLAHERNRNAPGWDREVVTIQVEWFGSAPDNGTDVIIERHPSGRSAIVLSPDFHELGITTIPFHRPISDIVKAQTRGNTDEVVVEFYGPNH